MQINYRDKTSRWAKRGNKIEKLQTRIYKSVDSGDLQESFLSETECKINELIDHINDISKKVDALTSKEEKKEEYLTDSKGNKWVATFGSAHDPHNPFPLKSEPKQECDHKDEDGYSYKCNYREVGENFKFCPLCGAKL